MIDVRTGAEIKNVRMLQFLRVYREELNASMLANPGAYALNLEETFTRFTSTYILGGAHFNLDDPSMRRTYKRLGLKRTYKALQAFFAS